ncbi:CYTOCHROME C OXIDASE SUBUNIT [Salix purpurea]|uniref:CYTOCHROME C OXIDASE SUBUNIT n=1 Tax=Salix purpurea TaxID=77065 RepID=A0A9Q0YX22_SALPP|nr:CYTOCHROME C OXIDASE SUBUNIT [Salix purpurea]
MASLHVQPSWLSSLTKNPTTLFSSKASPFKVSLSVNSSNAESPNNSSQNPSEPEPGSVDPVKLAFEKAKAYRNSIETSKNVKIEPNPDEDSGGSTIRNVEKNQQVSDPVMGSVVYKTSRGVVGSDGVVESIADGKTNSGLKGGNLGSGAEDKTSKKEQKTVDFRH